MKIHLGVVDQQYFKEKSNKVPQARKGRKNKLVKPKVNSGEQSTGDVAEWLEKKYSVMQGFVDIHMPKNTAAGFAISAIAAVVGFGLIWQMWLVAGIGFVAMIAATIYHTFNYNRDYFIPAAKVVRTEDERTLLLSSHV